jgi:hypothetical protein
MTQKEIILKAFKDNGNHLTLGYVLTFPWGYKFASRCADLRKDGYVIVCEEKPRPSDNVYRLIEVDKTGQLIAI